MKHLGIITALLPEAACFVNKPVKNQHIKISEQITLMVSGMGQDNAGNAAKSLLNIGADALISTGTAGALSPDIIPGDLIIPKSVITDDDVCYRISKEWHEHAVNIVSSLPMAVYTRNLYSNNRIINQSSEKRFKYKESGAIAIDMESAEILNVANSSHVPALVLRTVIDPSDFTIPEFVLNNSDKYGNARLFSLLISVIVKPARVTSLLKLSGYYKAANKNLSLIGKQLDSLILPSAPG